MKNIEIYILFGLLCLQTFSQNKNFIDQPFLETVVEIDTLVVPDKIHLLIKLNEEDNKNRKSTEELETSMLQILSALQIDLEKNLSILDYNSEFKKYFLGRQKVLKTKMYILILKDVKMIRKVMAELERKGISNVSINKTEYSKYKHLLQHLKTKAILKAKQNAEAMVLPLNQKIGKAIYISDLETEFITSQLQGKISGVQIRGFSSRIYGSRSSKLEMINFEKMKFSSKIKVKFIIE
jgi:hypothetical protein